MTIRIGRITLLVAAVLCYATIANAEDGLGWKCKHIPSDPVTLRTRKTIASINEYTNKDPYVVREVYEADVEVKDVASIVRYFLSIPYENRAVFPEFDPAHYDENRICPALLGQLLEFCVLALERNMEKYVPRAQVVHYQKLEKVNSKEFKSSSPSPTYENRVAYLKKWVAVLQANNLNTLATEFQKAISEQHVDQGMEKRLLDKIDREEGHSVVDKKPLSNANDITETPGDRSTYRGVFIEALAGGAIVSMIIVIMVAWRRKR